MAANNQIVIIGRAGNNVSEDMRRTQQGTAIAEVRVAVNRTTKDSQGNPITDWISCKFWDKQGERLAEFVKKGDLISVTGALRVDNWDSPQGEKRQKYYIHGENFQMLESRRAREERMADESSYGSSYRRESAPSSRPASSRPADDFGGEDAGYGSSYQRETHPPARPASSRPVDDFGSDDYMDDDELPPF